MKRTLALLFFIAGFTVLRAQDLIITKTDFRIQCKIVHEDSLSLFYRINNHPDELEIKRTAVKAYYYNLLRQKERPKRRSSVKDTAVTRKRRDIALLSFGAGFALPTGEFASMDYTKETSGLATPSILADLGGAVKLGKHLGLALGYHFQSNRINTKIFNDQAQAANPGIPFTTEATKWSAKGFFGGLYFDETIPQSIVTLYGSFSVGYLRYKSPEIISSVSLPGVYFRATIHSDSYSGIGYLWNAGVQLETSENSRFHFGVGYFYGQADFDYVLTTNSQGYSQLTNFSQKFTTLNINAGIVLVLRK